MRPRSSADAERAVTTREVLAGARNSERVTVQASVARGMNCSTGEHCPLRYPRAEGLRLRGQVRILPGVPICSDAVAQRQSA